MAKKEKEKIRPDTFTWWFAVHVYVLFVGTLIWAVGTDLYHAAKAVGKLYAGTI